jgi:transposase InsO family protein
MFDDGGMLIHMEEEKIGTLEDIRAFLAGTSGVEFRIAGKEACYDWIRGTLVRFWYLKLGKKDKGLVRRYMEKVTGYSRAQLNRLIAQYRNTGAIRRSQRTVNGFPRRYDSGDIALLAEVDDLHDGLSGTTTKKLCERAYLVHKDQRFQRLSQISVSHLYNLRGSSTYRRSRQVFQKTRPTKVNIGQRCKPRPNGSPGYLRVDTVHQGDRNGEKGVYHVNATDEITQFEIVVTVEKICEHYLLPALEEMLEQFPFIIVNFHADNGSEYINKKVAILLNTLLITLTKSRSRHSNDNALAESKNGAVVRKVFGYSHIPQRYAAHVEGFNREFLNPYINFHRPCHFPELTVDNKGKQKKTYPYRNMMTPYEKLKSLHKAQRYLKRGVNFSQLDQIAMQTSDHDAARALQEAREKLFSLIATGKAVA